jgi:hypothetical protein
MLLVEGERLLRRVHLEPEAVLATGGHLADDDGAKCALVRLELDERRILRRHGSARRRSPSRPRTRVGPARSRARATR